MHTWKNALEWVLTAASDETAKVWQFGGLDAG